MSPSSFSKTCIITALISSKEGKEQLLEQLLQDLVAATLKEPGCLIYRLHKSADHPGEFFMYEEWEDHSAYQAHRNTSHMEHWRKIRAPLVDRLEVSLWHALCR